MAELQAMSRKPMYMKDWVARLDDFLTMTGNDILAHAGKVSHETALDKAHAEYEKFKEQNRNELSQVETDFIKKIEITAKHLKSKKK